MKLIQSLFLIFLFISNSLLFSQNVQITYNGGRNYSLVERTDLRRYDNNRYTGLLSQEVRSFISNDGELYEGSFYVWRDTVRASQSVGDGIRDSIPSKFRITDDGTLTMLEDNGYPSFRSFPAFSKSRIKIGDSWQAKAIRAVDPLEKGIVTKIPMYVQYTYIGDEQVRGEDVYVISAKWATRYGASLYVDFGGDRELQSAQGKHEATMYVSKVTGYALVVRDSVDEVFTYSDGHSVALKGTISLFTEYPPAIDRSRIIKALQRVASISNEEAQELSKPVHEESFLPSTAIAKNDTKANNSFDNSSNNNKTPDPLFDDNHFPDMKNNNKLLASKDKNTSTNAKQNTKQLTKQNSEQIKSSNADSEIRKNTKQDSSKTKFEAVENAVKKVSYDNKPANSNGDNKAISQEEAAKPIRVENTVAGIRLTIQNLQFKPNSAELLPGEKSRLDTIASVLKEVPEAQLLVEGHTASTGYEEGEMKLSAERAHSIAKELTLRGIQKERFICKGSGAHKPIADNSTPQGKAINRRVEITILE